MLVNIKNLTFSLFIVIGFYIFIYEYEKISNLYLEQSSLISEINIIKQSNDDIKVKKKSNDKKNIDKKIKYEKLIVEINKGDTFVSILKKNNLPEKQIFEIINKVENIFDLKKIKAGSKIHFFINDLGITKKIEMDLDVDSVISVEINGDIKVEIRKLHKDFFQESKEFKINESLYNDGLKNNLPKDILIKLIKLFSFDLDFQRDIRKNTVVSVSYDFNLIKENNKIEFNDINYALISIEGKKLEYFKFLTDDGYIDYFNRDGKNVKKSILKTPIDGARLSSSFGMRKHPISGFNKMHKGVDFAAPTGTPIYAGGNGVIEYIGRNGGYGKYIRIRHNNEYKTAYAHLSKYKNGLSKGSRVNQGEIIGFVGSTGKSTGPHLHYEILFQNKQINPLKLKLPSGKILEGEELLKFKKQYKVIYANHLNLLYE